MFCIYVASGVLLINQVALSICVRNVTFRKPVYCNTTTGVC